MAFLTWLASLLVLIGGLNWGLIGFFNWDLVAAIFGRGDQRARGPRIVYAIVGVASLWILLASLLYRKW